MDESERSVTDMMGDAETLPPPAGGNVTRCRLLRADGSEWTVTGLHHAVEGLQVDAVHYAMPSAGADGRGRSVPSMRRLEGEPLSRGDLLQWIGDDGEVLWSLTAPARPLLA